MITTTSADGTNVVAVDEGQGPVILVLHPGMDDGRSWGKVAARLAPRFRVVRPHRRQYRLDIATGSPSTIAQEVDDVQAIDQLGVRLDVYARIEVPTVLLGGDRSPAHLGERLDALARALPRAEKVVLRGQGHGANQRAPGEVARIIETLADKVLR